MEKNRSTLLLTLLIGINIGLWGRTLLPEKINLESFSVDGTAWRGQKIVRVLGPDEIMMDMGEGYLPMEEALEYVPEELECRDLARGYIKAGSVEAAHKKDSH